MKYALNTWMCGGEPLQKTLARLQRLGYDGVELSVMEPNKIDPHQIKRLVSDYGLVVSSLEPDWSWVEKRELCNKDRKVRQEAILYLKRCLELGKELGAISIQMVPSAVGKPWPLASPEDEWKWAIEAVAEGAEYAEQLGILIALEVVNRYEVYMVNTVDDAIRFIGDVGSASVRVHLDCFHLNIEEPDLPLAFLKAGNLLINTHIADSNRQAVGKGHVDFKSVVRVLKEIDYPYYLTVELLSKGADPTNLSQGFTPDEDLLDVDAKTCITLLKLYETVA